MFPFQQAPQGALAVVKARAHRAQLAADDAGDLVVGHVFEKTEHEHLALLRRQLVERGVDGGGVLGGELRAVVADVGRQLLFVQRDHRRPPLPQQSIRPVARDAVQPGSKRLRLTQPRHLAEDVEPDVLQEVFGPAQAAQ